MEDEEWEICEDDGFVYKRRKRNLPDSAPQQPSAVPEEDLRRNQLARRKVSLLAIRERYRKEIGKLEGLAASLLEDSCFGGSDGYGGGFGVAGEESTLGTIAGGRIPGSCHQKDGGEVSEAMNPTSCLIEELILQVEAQEAILKKLSNICDIADSVCDMREEAMMESFLDLPVWESPRTLMASLVD